MRTPRSTVPVVLSLLALSAVVVAPGVANACGMSVRLEPIPQKPTPVQEIARAEKALEAGSPGIAARVVVGTFGKVRGIEAGKDALQTRALRVFALAVVRSGGAVQEKNLGVPEAEGWTTHANLEWAAQALREIDAKRPNDPSLQADLGEALARLPQSEGEAMLLLGKLAQKDLMGSPHAYAALARLRAKTGDEKGAEAARARCEEMTKTKDVCKPAEGERPKAPAVAAAAVRA